MRIAYRSTPTLAAALLAGLLLAAAPAPAQAATCSDYSNQAEAQRAADTRDADGDGVYCEALPCPCLRPNPGGPPDPIVEPPPPPPDPPTPAEPNGESGRRSQPDRLTRRGSRRRYVRGHAQRFRARITEVIDGDTVRISSRETRRRSYTVRLIGIDTPETRKPGTPVECGGRGATSAMLGLAFSAPTGTDGDGLLDAKGGSGDRATVTTDPTQDLFDRYGRLLAYVTTDDSENLAVEQLRAGWAETYVYERRFRQYDRFLDVEATAMETGAGAHTLCGGDFHKPAG
jgi:micrococcal nuclease